MSDYRPPLEDIRLVLDEISDISAICDLPGYEHVDPETVDSVLDELGRFVAEVVAPVHRIGDEAGCTVTAFSARMSCACHFRKRVPRPPF